MLFSWLRNRRRRRLLADPFPDRWEKILHRNVGHYALLSAEEQRRLRDATRILVAEKEWLGRGGLFISEEMKVTIAAQAGLLLLGNDRDYFAPVREVVVFPTTFRTPVAEDDWEDDELSETALSGQAVDRGPVLLAWDEVLAEGRKPDGRFNVVIHEFAHQLDFHEQLMGRAPPLNDPELESRWRYVLAVAYENHRRAIKERAPATFFTPHAADSEAEFFADATEAYFCWPAGLTQAHPEIYRLLAAYYRCDPAVWFHNRR